MELKRKSRRKIFYALVVVFILVSPILIAYALGYTFDLNRGSVDKVGGIFVKARDYNISVFVNNSFVKETSLVSNGALITGLEPGVYLLRLEKPGFQSWSKTVKVEAGLVTEMRQVILVTNPLRISTSTPAEISFIAKSSARPQSNFKVNKDGDLLERSSGRKVASNVKSFGVIDSQPFFVDKNGFLAKFDAKTNAIETLGRPGFFIGEEDFEFIGSPTKKEVAVLDSQRGLYLWDGESNITTFGGGVSGVYFDEGGEKLLILKEDEIAVLWLKDNARQPFQKKGAREKVLQYENILDARWFFGDNAHVIVQTKDGIFLTELDGREGRNTVELVSGITDRLFTSPEYPDTIFYTRKKDTKKIEL